MQQMQCSRPIRNFQLSHPCAFSSLVAGQSETMQNLASWSAAAISSAAYYYTSKRYSSISWLPYRPKEFASVGLKQLALPFELNICPIYLRPWCRAREYATGKRTLSGLILRQYQPIHYISTGSHFQFLYQCLNLSDNYLTWLKAEHPRALPVGNLSVLLTIYKCTISFQSLADADSVLIISIVLV